MTVVFDANFENLGRPYPEGATKPAAHALRELPCLDQWGAGELKPGFWYFWIGDGEPYPGDQGILTGTSYATWITGVQRELRVSSYEVTPLPTYEGWEGTSQQVTDITYTGAVDYSWSLFQIMWKWESDETPSTSWYITDIDPLPGKATHLRMTLPEYTKNVIGETLQGPRIYFGVIWPCHNSPIEKGDVDVRGVSVGAESYCTEPYVTGEVLLDGGFEDGSSNGVDRVPVADGLNQEWDYYGANPSIAWPTGSGGWMAGDSSAWEYSTVNPRTGTYHLRSTYGTPVGGMQLFRQFPCDADAPFGYEPYSARVVQNSDVTFSMWFSPVSGSGHSLQFTADIYDESHSNVGSYASSVMSHSGASAYEQASWNFTIAEATAYWVVFDVLFTGSSAVFDLDDASMTIV